MEHTPSPEFPEAPLNVYGFAETPDLQRRRHEAISALSGGDLQPAIGYRLAAEEIVARYQGDAQQRAEIGMQLAVAGIRRDAGRTEVYLEDLNAILPYAQHRGYNDIAEDIQAEIDRICQD